MMSCEGGEISVLFSREREELRLWEGGAQETEIYTYITSIHACANVVTQTHTHTLTNE